MQVKVPIGMAAVLGRMNSIDAVSELVIRSQLRSVAHFLFTLGVARTHVKDLARCSNLLCILVIFRNEKRRFVLLQQSEPSDDRSGNCAS